MALCWYVPLLQEGGQVRLVGSASMDALPTNDARSTTQQILLFLGISSRAPKLIPIPSPHGSSLEQSYKKKERSL